MMKNICRDAGTDFNDIFLRKGGHYDPATHFYEEIAEQYGKDNKISTDICLRSNFMFVTMKVF